MVGSSRVLTALGLKLHRKTLRHLEIRRLREALGAAVASERPGDPARPLDQP